MPWCPCGGDQPGQGSGGPWQGKPCHIYTYTHSLSMLCVQVDVVRGCGRYIPRAPYSDIVYSRILQRDRVCVPKAVEREPYSGPVIQLPSQ